MSKQRKHSIFGYLFILFVSPFLFLLVLVPKAQSKEKVEVQQKRAVLLFVGDLMGHLPQLNSAKTDSGYNFSPVYSYVESYISNADFSIGNLETVLAGKERGFSGYPMFNSPDEYAHALKEVGFDMLMTINNHSIDQGVFGIKETIKKLNTLGMPYEGTFASPQDADSIRIFSINGIRIAFVGFSYGLNGNMLPEEYKYATALIDTTLIKQKIQRAKALSPDAIITYFHFGQEYKRIENEFQRSIVKVAIASGSDVVWASHPHVLQPIEWYKSGNDSIPVAYSLGNFISNQRDRYTDTGAMLCLTIDKDTTTRVSKVSVIPTWVFKGLINNKTEYRILPLNDTTSFNHSFLTPSDSKRIREAYKESIEILNKRGAFVGASK